MAIIKKEGYRCVNPSDNLDRIEYKRVTKVNSKGVFSMNLPEEFIETFQLSSYENTITGNSLNEIESKFSEMHKKYYDKEISSELVVKFAFISSCHYATNSKGEIYHNGSLEDSEWSKTMGVRSWSHDYKPYTVGLYADVLRQVTTTIRGKSKITYDRCYNGELGKYGMLLQELVRMGPPDEGEINLLPATEINCKFFYETAMSLCKLTEHLRSFNSSESITKAINGDIKFLGA